jgi:hypothetical protein
MCDNQSCIVLSKTTKNHDCTKHIDIKYHYLQEKVASLKIEFKYCPTKQMLTNVLIKALPKPKYQFCVEGIGLTILKYDYVFLLMGGVKDRDLLKYNLNRHTLS